MGTLRVLLFSLAVFSASIARAEERTIGADLKFVSEVAAVQPGVPFTVALHIHHHPGFHTYWKYQGIVGVPTSIDWKLPKGFTAGPIQWPAPKVVDMATHPAHGYHRDVLLLIEIVPPKHIESDSITLAGDLTWMACSKSCHPGWATRRITLPVNRTGTAKLDQGWAEKISVERGHLPAPSKLWNVTIESKRDANPVKIRIRPAKKSHGDPGDIYFFSEDGQITSEPPQVVKRQPDGSYLIVATRSQYSPKKCPSLPGTIVGSGSWASGAKMGAIRVEPRYP